MYLLQLQYSLCLEMKFQMVIVIMDISSHFNNKNRILIGNHKAIVSRGGCLCGDQRKAVLKENIIMLVFFISLMTNLGDSSND